MENEDLLNDILDIAKSDLPEKTMIIMAMLKSLIRCYKKTEDFLSLSKIFGLIKDHIDEFEEYIIPGELHAELIDLKCHNPSLKHEAMQKLTNLIPKK